MRARLDAAGRKIQLDFAEKQTLREFVDSALRDEGFVVELPASLKLYEQFQVTLSDGEAHVEVPVQVLQVFPGTAGGHCTALQIAEPERLQRFAASLASQRDQPAEGEMTGASPAFRIRQLNVSQKMLLAAKASRGERQILLRDSSPQVLMGLLANPRIEDREVLEIVRSTHAASGVLQRVAKDRRWAGNYEIRLAVVKNPKTPPVLAQRLLPTLNKKDLGVLGKSSHVREAVKAAALRLYLKKG